MTGFRSALLAAVAVAGVAVAAAPASAAMSQYARYYASITAAQKCQGKSFTQAEHYKLANRIRDRVGHMVDDQLMQLEKGKDSMSARIRKYGCNDENVQSALELYDEDLASAAMMQ